ncbi:MAG: hypothetical protein QY323_02670 [Patescibacteria group bacterium]|nr:MAG: hypothetical protein QY323_02670 [Patescibacteria group bacterium]
MKVIHSLLCLAVLAIASCAVRPDGTADDQGDDDQNDPQPNGCQSDADCDDGPTACHVGTCVRDACSYVSSCDSGEVCNAQNLCEEQTTPPPPPPPSGNGTIVCSDPSGSTQTTVTVSNGILAHLIGGDGLNPNSNWSVRFGVGSGGTDAKAWAGDGASYVLVMPNTVALFNFVLQDGNGQQYWFDLNEFDVSGTCSHAPNATAVTHTVPGGTTTDPGNGTVSCTEQGSQTYVTISNGILAHVFNQNGFTPSSLRFGYGLSDWESWVSDSTTYVLTMPNTTTEFNLFVRDTAGVDHWFDVNQFNVSGTCSKITGAFTHAVTSVGNGSISCAESGSDTNVTISNGILAHVFNQNGFTPSSLRFGYGLSDWESWVSDSTTYVLTMPNTTTEFNLFVRDTAGVDHWFDVNQFNVSGTCSKTTGAFTHTAQSVGNGSLHCAESGSNTTVTVSNGILAHLVGTPSYSPSLLQFEYGGSQTLSWNGDGATYTFTMGNTVTAFNLRLRDVNGNAFPFDVSEFNVSGTCSKTSNAFTHTLSTTTIVGNIHCRLWDVGGVTKREVTITPNGNGIIAGTFSEGSPVTTPENIRINTNGPQQTWIGNGQSYVFYADVSLNGFNFFIVDNDDVASGSDTVAGGDWFNLAAWTFTNENNGLGTSNCHVSGGGIVVN